DVTQNMVVACVKMLGDIMQRPYGEKVVDYTPPWQRLKYADLFQKYVGVPMHDDAAVRRVAERDGIPTANVHPDWAGGHRVGQLPPGGGGAQPVRAPGRGQAGRAGVRVRLPGVAVPANQALPGQPEAGAAVRAVRAGHGTGQRLHRAERPGVAGGDVPATTGG